LLTSARLMTLARAPQSWENYNVEGVPRGKEYDLYK
jgi:hypothetical protein